MDGHGPLFHYVLARHVFDDGDGIFADAIILDKEVELRGEHGLQEI